MLLYCIRKVLATMPNSQKKIAIKTSILSPIFSKKGQSIAEFAIVVPVFVVIAMLVIDLANMVLVAHRLNAAAREAVRVATENGDPLGALPAGVACSLNGGGGGVNACALGSTTICCIALSRADIVLFHSGLTNVPMWGTYIQQSVPGTNLQAAGSNLHAFFRVDLQQNVNYFFKIATQAVSGFSVAYADRIT